MEASSSKQNGANSGNDDRLSDLPDCLLHTILSLLKARQVVQTCVLSRRWQHLWLDAPFLDIDSCEFPVNYPSCWSWEDFRHRWQAFREAVFRRLEDFVDNLLLHRSTRSLHLHSLRLRIDDNDDKTDDPCISRWIRHGLSCTPAVLVIHHGAAIMLPPPSTSGSTRRLKKLCLDQVTLHHGFDQHIIAGLPVLEDLRFRNTDLGILSQINSRTLRNLTIDCCQNTGSTSLAIVAPRLTSLRFTILFYNRASFIVAEAPLLAEACIRLVKKPKQKPCLWKLGSKPDMSMLRDLSELLRSLFNSNVSSLKLKGFPKLLVGQNDVAFPVPHKDGMFEAKPIIWNMMKSDKFVLCPMLHWILEENRHRFGNLQTLMLDNCEAGDKMQVLWCFLHNTPVLEKLTLNNCKFSDGMVLGKSRLKPLSSNILVIPPGLRLLEIRYSDKYDHELRHQGIRSIDEVMSTIRTKLPATTMIQATKVPRKRRAN